MSTTTMRWARRFPTSANNFDLVLANPQELDTQRILKLLEGILEETHRGLTLSSRAYIEFRRWLQHPGTPLRSDAYVLLSNWFMTKSGDRNSLVATRCEAFWDAIFPCRPLDRLSSPEAGRNHVIVPAEFDRFWRRLLNAQGENLGETTASEENGLNPDSSTTPNRIEDLPDANDRPHSDQLRAVFDKLGLHCEVEGNPHAVADFLRIVSRWETSEP